MSATDRSGFWSGAATLPNAITMLRLVLIVAFGVLLVTGRDAWAITALAVAGVSDFLDGFLARRLGQTSELGRVLDPAADRLLTLVVVLGLAGTGVIPWWLACLLLGRDLVMGIALLWLRARTTETPQVTWAGKTATFALYVFLPLAYLADGRWDTAHTVAIVGSTLAGGIYWFSALQYLRAIRAAGTATPGAAPHTTA